MRTTRTQPQVTGKDVARIYLIALACAAALLVALVAPSFVMNHAEAQNIRHRPLNVREVIGYSGESPDVTEFTAESWDTVGFTATDNAVSRTIKGQLNKITQVNQIDVSKCLTFPYTPKDVYVRYWDGKTVDGNGVPVYQDGTNHPGVLICDGTFSTDPIFGVGIMTAYGG